MQVCNYMHWLFLCFIPCMCLGKYSINQKMPQVIVYLPLGTMEQFGFGRNPYLENG